VAASLFSLQVKPHEKNRNPSPVPASAPDMAILFYLRAVAGGYPLRGGFTLLSGATSPSISPYFASCALILSRISTRM
jgi:hypothetical protein